MQYNHREIEKKWQKYWADKNIFKANNKSTKPKYYVLDMFPYPSGAGLHVGHPLGYIASDIYARYKRHKGFNVLHPQGFDSFGLPAEQYAIQTGKHPAVTTKINITTYREQLKKMGFSFDWSRELQTSNPKYYKWTQWIFIQLFNSWYNIETDKAEDISSLIKEFEASGNKQVNAACDQNTASFTANQWRAFSNLEKQQVLLRYRLTYLSDTEVNWCPALGTVLANDEIVNGVSERGGHAVVRKKMTQWSMRITAYAQRLLDGLDKIDWPLTLKNSQINWIGQSQGAMLSFKVEGCQLHIEVFSTRPDTVFGVSFICLAPEHEWVDKITTKQQWQAVQAYVKASARRSERDRLADVKNISGVFTGAYAYHPFTGKKIPIWIADYVLASYGTGAVMAVPCGDQRDYDFAKHFKLDIPNIFKNVDISEKAFVDKKNTIIANSDFLNGLSHKKAMKTIIAQMERQAIGYGKVNYRLRDAVFSRQRYWGEPFPVYYKDGMPQVIDPAYLPVVLPEVKKYLPTSDGKPPLGNASIWAWNIAENKVVSNELIDNKKVLPLELNTMPGWAGSSWYFNRYMDPANDTEFASKQAVNYWREVDLYMGGAEHATGHLLYARFWQMFLYDKNHVTVEEFAKKMINQGMILGTSAIIYRISGTHKYVSKGLKDNYKTEKLRVPIDFINTSDQLDIASLKKWQPQFSETEFILEDGKYTVGREVEKMSKSKYNVVNPNDICDKYGADSLRLFEMFLGPLEQAKPWKTEGISGVYSFLKKLWKLFFKNNYFEVSADKPTNENLKTLHKTIKKIEEDIESFSFNTSVSSFMIAVNELSAQKCNNKSILEQLLVLISPYAPHITEELWSKLGNKESIAFAPFPKYQAKYLTESEKEYPVSFNGKIRFKLNLALNLSKGDIEKTVMANAKTQEQLKGRVPKKVIVVLGKIINIVT
ncbi:MAG: leucine--tRNA ligase [Tenacibaculum sp.]